LGLDGDHQLANAGVAVALGQVLPAGLRPSPSAVSQGLAEVRHAGRMEWLAPDLLVDCAHNPDGAARLAAAIRALPEDRRPRSLLFGASEDKDARGIVVTLAPLVERIYVTHCAHPRSARAGDLAARLVGIGVPLLPAGPVEDALPVARARGPVLVAGSIFLVGAVRDLVTG
jgi:dihydrofolate synthase/folylpolyglutamate synthase